MIAGRRNAEASELKGGGIARYDRNVNDIYVLSTDADLEHIFRGGG